MARACGHTHLSQFNLNDITTWKREMADLTGIKYAGVGWPQPEDKIIFINYTPTQQEEKQPMSTQDNLQAAFAGESQANRKYLAFAAKADAEGHPQIAKLFRAAAAAETVHAHAHLRVMGGVKDTKQNLQAAIEGEGYEFKEMYPGFIKEAEAEGNKAAVISFRNANAVEKIASRPVQRGFGDAGRPGRTCPLRPSTSAMFAATRSSAKSPTSARSAGHRSRSSRKLREQYPCHWCGGRPPPRHYNFCNILPCLQSWTNQCFCTDSQSKWGENDVRRMAVVGQQ